MKASYWKKKMKLFYLIVSLSCLFFINTSAFAKPVSVETAKLVAENWLSQITGIAQQSLAAVPDEGHAALLADGSSPSYHIVSMDQGGWAIVSGDDVAQPIIGYATQGTISQDDLPPAFSEWMAEVKAQIETAAQNATLQLANSEIGTDIQSAWKNLDVTNYGISDKALGAVAPLVTYDNSLGAVTPLITTTWSQGQYYNNQCPVDSAGPDGHALVGCCATAIGQVMKYHNWPDSGTGSHSYYHPTYGTLSADFGSTTYNWSSMPASGRVTSDNSAVATLLYHVGVSIDMNYGPSASGCSGSKIATGLGTYFKYKPVTFVSRSSYSDSVWKGMMRTDLDAGRPIVYAGSGTDGHAFVCDGYSGNDYFHFNWGWNGAYDGYFFINDLTPGSDNFNYYQGAIFGIEPLKGGVPGKATLISPDSNTLDTTPTYTWNEVSDATWYYLWVNDSTGNKIKQWHEASVVCSGSTCSVTPSTVLANGSADWWIQTYSTAGYGPWSDGMSFSVGAPAPSRATLVSPSGTTDDATPTYTWNAADNATWYYLWVNDSTGNKIKQWHEASAVCSGSTCSVTPSTVLANGSAAWWIQTWNTVGYGPWSDGMQIHIPDPGAASLITPTGAITDSTPTYSWNVVSNATWYYLWVNDATGNKIKQWYEASAVCSGSTCSVKPATGLANGNGTWWIQTYSSGGYGSWSPPMDFKVTATAGGFNSQFNGNASGWWRLNTAATWSVDSKNYYTQGSTSYDASTYYGSYSDSVTMYDNFDYEVQLWRSGGAGSNGIMFRGNPNPSGFRQSWDHGYGFYYTRDGYYSIWKYTGGSGTSLQWSTQSSAINQGDAWNTLRVRANGSNIDFYINGTHLATLTGASYTTGKVGIEMSKALWDEAGTIWANYATLTELTPAMAGEADTTGTDVFVIDEAAIMAQGGASSDGNDTAVGHVSQQNDSFQTASESVPEVQFEKGPDS